jgi:hypothetical protein
MISNQKKTKTRFLCLSVIEDLIEWQKDNSAYFKKYLKNRGFIWDEKNLYDVYKDFNRPINLNEGDLICIEPFCGLQTITDKHYDVDNDIVVYNIQTQ